MISKLMSNLNISKKITLALSIPMIGMAFFSSYLVWEKMKIVETTEKLRKLTEFAESISFLVHEQQKERGMIAAFLGSEGKKFRAELPQQRKETDSKKEQFQKFVATLNPDEYSKNFNKKLEKFQGELKRIDSIRSSVDIQAITTKDVVEFYKDLNLLGLDIISGISSLSTNPKVVIALSAYTNLLQIIERMGIESAVGAGGFSSGAFFPPAVRKMQELIKEQEIYENVFKSFATDEQNSVYNGAMVDSAVRETIRMRKIALEYPLNRTLEGIEADYWFQILTQKINLFINVEREVIGTINELVDHVIEDATSSEVAFIIISVISAFIAVGLGYVSIKSVSSPIVTVTNAMAQLTKGETKFKLPSADGRDEVAEMVKSMNELKDSVTDSFRIQTALDSVTANVMMADQRGIIVYMNPSVMQMMKTAESDIKKDLPNFETAKLVGTNIDDFHKNPEHQRGILEKMKKKYESSIKVGSRSFDLVANPVFNKDGDRLGTVVEWKDMTAELAIQDEVGKVVAATTNGDFTKRLEVEGKEGFMLSLSEGINKIGEVSLEGLTEVVNILGALSRGDLTQKIEGEYEGLFDDIKQALNTTIEQLSKMAKNIKVSAGAVNSASNEISSGSEDLSQRTEQQASTLEETAASMEELTGTVRQNSENAAQANNLSSQASSVAGKGGEVVGKAVEAMGRIEESAKKISDIIGVIDDIAFQTNLLALNAAVEAARAGDAGKGFAVVASEVRTLAGRSASASKDIKTLINESSEQVTQGSQLVNEAGTTLKDIVGSIKEVASLVSEIASASSEQATGIEEINTAVVQMDEGTQQNAALVEENTAAAQSLVEQSEELENLVNFFTIEDDERQEEEEESEEKAKTFKAKPSNVKALKVVENKNTKARNGKKKEPKKSEKTAKSVVAKKAANNGSGSSYEKGWEEF